MSEILFRAFFFLVMFVMTVAVLSFGTNIAVGSYIEVTQALGVCK